MHKHRIIVLAIVIVLLTAAAWSGAASTVCDQKGVLTGHVSAMGLVAPGSTVKEGQVLVYVDTITGPIPAARANVDGKVIEVLVRPGDTVKSGDTLVRVEKAGK